MTPLTPFFAQIRRPLYPLPGPFRRNSEVSLMSLWAKDDIIFGNWHLRRLTHRRLSLRSINQAKVGGKLFAQKMIIEPVIVCQSPGITTFAQNDRFMTI